MLKEDTLASFFDNKADEGSISSSVLGLSSFFYSSFTKSSKYWSLSSSSSRAARRSSALSFPPYKNEEGGLIGIGNLTAKKVWVRHCAAVGLLLGS